MSWTFSRKSSGSMPWRCHQPVQRRAVFAIEFLLQLARLLARQRQQLRHIGRHLHVDLREQVRMVRIERVVEVEHPVGDMGEAGGIGKRRSCSSLWHEIEFWQRLPMPATYARLRVAKMRAMVQILGSPKGAFRASWHYRRSRREQRMSRIFLKSTLRRFSSLLASRFLLTLIVVPAIGGVRRRQRLADIHGLPAGDRLAGQRLHVLAGREAEKRPSRPRPRSCRACRSAPAAGGEGKPRRHDRHAQPRELLCRARSDSRRKADRGALLIIDADHFKLINDSYRPSDRRRCAARDCRRDRARRAQRRRARPHRRRGIRCVPGRRHRRGGEARRRAHPP